MENSALVLTAFLSGSHFLHAQDLMSEFQIQSASFEQHPAPNALEMTADSGKVVHAGYASPSLCACCNDTPRLLAGLDVLFARVNTSSENFSNETILRPTLMFVDPKGFSARARYFEYEGSDENEEGTASMLDLDLIASLRLGKTTFGGSVTAARRPTRRVQVCCFTASEESAVQAFNTHQDQATIGRIAGHQVV